MRFENERRAFAQQREAREHGIHSEVERLLAQREAAAQAAKAAGAADGRGAAEAAARESPAAGGPPPVPKITPLDVQNALRTAVNAGVVGIGSGCVVSQKGIVTESTLRARVKDVNYEVQISHIDPITRVALQPGRRSTTGVDPTPVECLTHVFGHLLLQEASPDAPCGLGIDMSHLVQGRPNCAQDREWLSSTELAAVETATEVQIAHTDTIILMAGTGPRLFAAWCALTIIPIAKRDWSGEKRVPKAPGVPSKKRPKLEIVDEHGEGEQEASGGDKGSDLPTPEAPTALGPATGAPQ